MKKIIFTSLIALLSISTFSQKATLTGVVKDYKTNETLPGINVVYAPGEGTATDLDGVYTLTLDPGTYTIKYFSSLISSFISTRYRAEFKIKFKGFFIS